MLVWAYLAMAGVAGALGLVALGLELYLSWRARLLRQMRAVSFSSVVRVGMGDGSECVLLLE